VVAIPRFGTGLDEPAAYLPLVLWDAARVDAAIGGFSGPDAAVIGAARAFLRSLRRSFGGRLMLLLRGFRLLVLLPLLRFALFFTLLLVLCVGGSNGSKEEKQSPCADITIGLYTQSGKESRLAAQQKMLEAMQSASKAVN